MSRLVTACRALIKRNELAGTRHGLLTLRVWLEETAELFEGLGADASDLRAAASRIGGELERRIRAA